MGWCSVSPGVAVTVDITPDTAQLKGRLREFGAFMVKRMDELGRRINMDLSQFHAKRWETRGPVGAPWPISRKMFRPDHRGYTMYLEGHLLRSLNSPHGGLHSIREMGVDLGGLRIRYGTSVPYAYKHEHAVGVPHRPFIGVEYHQQGVLQQTGATWAAEVLNEYVDYLDGGAA